MSFKSKEANAFVYIDSQFGLNLIYPMKMSEWLEGFQHLLMAMQEENAFCTTFTVLT